MREQWAGARSPRSERWRGRAVTSDKRELRCVLEAAWGHGRHGRRPLSRLAAAREGLDDDHAMATARARTRQDLRLAVVSSLDALRLVLPCAGLLRAALGPVRYWRLDRRKLRQSLDLAGLAPWMGAGPNLGFAPCPPSARSCKPSRCVTLTRTPMALELHQTLPQLPV
jgi:hypothetical protein